MRSPTYLPRADPHVLHEPSNTNGLGAPSGTALRNRTREKVTALLQRWPCRWNPPGVVRRTQRLQAKSTSCGLHAALGRSTYANELHLPFAAGARGDQFPIARDDAVKRIANGIRDLLGIPKCGAPFTGIASAIGLKVPIGPQGCKHSPKSLIVSLGREEVHSEDRVIQNERSSGYWEVHRSVH